MEQHKEQVDPSVVYWTKGGPWENFGDALTTLLLELGSETPVVDAAKYHLLGSVIDDRNIREGLVGLSDHDVIAIWGGGVRSYDGITPEFRNRIKPLGVRGPLSRDILGLPPDTTLGDPALLLPYIYEPKASDLGDVSICVTHAFHEYNPASLKEACGADVVLSAKLPPGRYYVEQLIDRIVGAKFVLAGCLHAAVVACAYRRPFAFFDGGYIDIPLKWRDFAESVQIPHYFVHSLNEAIEKAKTDPIQPRIPQPESILSQYPFQINPRIIGAIAAGRLLTGENDRGRNLASSDIDQRTMEYKNDQLRQHELRISALQKNADFAKQEFYKQSVALLEQLTRAQSQIVSLQHEAISITQSLNDHRETSKATEVALEQRLIEIDDRRLKQIEDMRSQRKKELSELQEMLEQVGGAKIAAESRANSLSLEIEPLRHQIELLRNSTSWKITEPIRVAKKKCPMVCPRNIFLASAEARHSSSPHRAPVCNDSWALYFGSPPPFLFGQSDFQQVS